MPIIATPGAANANSFLTVEEGDAFAAEHLNSTAWTSASTAQKEAALIMATRLISRSCFEGVAANSTQSLPFPRSGLLTRTGYVLDSSIIPSDLKLATFEYALILLRSPTSFSESEVSAQGINKIKAGPVEIGFDSSSRTYKILPEEVKSLLVSSWLCDLTKKIPLFEVL